MSSVPDGEDELSRGSQHLGMPSYRPIDVGVPVDVQEFIALLGDRFGSVGVSANSRIVEDLGFDSLMLYELLCDIEDLVGVPVDETEFTFSTMSVDEVFLVVQRATTAEAGGRERGSQ